MSSRFSLSRTPIEGLMVLERRRIADHRGYLERLFSRSELSSYLRTPDVLQINRTLTASAGTVRGLHFQRPPHAEIKFVTCLKGEVFDVAVDFRRDSVTFLSWHAEVLSADNGRTMVVPEGFAHGFQALRDDCELLYLHTAEYVPEAESGINAKDPSLAIAWPMNIADQSSRDASLPFVTDLMGGAQ